MDPSGSVMAVLDSRNQTFPFPRLSRHNSITEKYLANASSRSNQYSDPAREIYMKALEFHKESFPDNRKKSKTWLSSQNTLQDVLAVLGQAKMLYEAKKSSRSRKLATGTAMWTKICSRMMHYSQIIDTLVSSNPEYAAIVWGGLRFIFTVTLNHENLASRIAEAFLEILSALDDAEFMAFKLYPVDHIQRTTIELYSGVVEFCIRATRWYQNTTKSVRRKVLLSIINPWPLEFEDIKLKIDKSLARLHNQSAVAHRAETRDMNITLQDLNSRFTLMYRDYLNHTTNNVQTPGNITYFPLPASISASFPFVPDRAASYLQVSFDPLKILDLSLVMRNRRRSRKDFSYQKVVMPPTVYESMASPHSSLVRIKASAIRSESVQDCVLDVAEQLRRRGLPVIWFLGGSLIRSGTPVSVEDVFKSMIQQMVNQQPEMFPRAPVDDRAFDSCKSPNDWLQLFVALLSHVERIFIVIDGHERLSGISDLIGRLWELLRTERVTTIVKMIVLAYQSLRAPLAPLAPENSPEYVDIDFSKVQPSLGRFPARHGLR